jgi:hypothetical protein
MSLGRAIDATCEGQGAPSGISIFSVGWMRRASATSSSLITG